MGFQLFQSLFAIEASSLTVSLLAIGSFIAWWIVRKRLRDFWMPIIRILEFPVSRLPRVILKRPPLIPFLMFVIAALALTIWSYRPRVKIFSDFEPGMTQVHIYVDMSPSVSAHITLNDLSQKLVGLLEQIGPKARVTFGTSLGDEVYEMTTPAAAAEIIAGLGFHRAGAKIGAGVRAQIGKIGEVDQLFVISDRDQHSWTGFQWQYLLVDADIRHVDVDNSSSRSSLPNIFFQDAKFTSAPGALTMDWDIEIAEGALARQASGTLTASIGGDSLATANWEIPTGRRSTTVSISWPSTKIPKDLFSEPIEWTLEVAGGDALLMDNKFRTPALGRRDRVVVIGEPTGELRLEDALMPLETALRVNGFEVDRYDRWPSNSRDGIPDALQSARFLAVLSSEGTENEMWCPVLAKNSMPIWLIPSAHTGTFTSICKCLVRFDIGIASDMCDERMSRENWIATLSGIGAKQIGGDIGFANQAIAMRLLNKSIGVDLTVFTVPLRPDTRIGITWGLFPVMIRQLAAFTGGQSGMNVGDARGMGGIWPRVSDISLLSQGESSFVESRSQILRETNVPIGESLMAAMPVNELPPTWSSSGGSSRMRNASKRDSEDPWPWVRVLVGLVLFASFVEGIWLWRRQRLRRSQISLVWIVVASSLLLRADFGLAQVRIDWLGPKDFSSAQFQTLAREVSSRTSLELSSLPNFLENFNEKSAEYPWIWTNMPSKLAGKDGRISGLGRLWLKRGGILIIDGVQSDSALDTLMEPFLQGTVKPSGWMAMPPDHEFMRSFYLLNSLPSCKGRQWKIFSFDGRVVALASPYSLLGILQDQPAKWTCESNITNEQQVRIFVNLLLMAFTTDYKRDQIHLPEILKRLRVP